ncbi:hypothetical protein [Halorussus sp. MSC15.2]|uniref:hypothetical protein n=1 Tax=Halorussus sp. MSC15.2 TaxID=2283638 RepID=UPI0013D35C2A|nr:hypothetical protein [Halorussus sp. MSC15.2]NEU56280.1 hypothetical protein [Halorussus sp. MSC15.2]
MNFETHWKFIEAITIISVLILFASMFGLVPVTAVTVYALVMMLIYGLLNVVSISH